MKLKRSSGLCNSVVISTYHSIPGNFSTVTTSLMDLYILISWKTVNHCLFPNYIEYIFRITHVARVYLNSTQAYFV